MSAENTKTETATDVATVRTITIVTTRGEKQKINYEGTDWAGLKSLLQSGGTNIEGGTFPRYDLSNMKCVESVNRHTLEHPNATIPDGNFNLFLMPYKSKSGADLSRPDAYAKIKSFIEKDGVKATDHFNAGKNYTTKKTVELNELIESYKPGTKKAVSKEKAQAIADVVESVQTAKGEGNEETSDIMEELQGLSTDEKLDIVIKLLVDMRKGAVAVTPAVPVETEEEKAARLQKEEKDRLAKEEAERVRKEEEEAKELKRKEEEEKRRKKKEEDDALDAEMRNLAGGFNDVRL